MLKSAGSAPTTESERIGAGPKSFVVNCTDDGGDEVPTDTSPKSTLAGMGGSTGRCSRMKTSESSFVSAPGGRLSSALELKTPNRPSAEIAVPNCEPSGIRVGFAGSADGPSNCGEPA